MTGWWLACSIPQTGMKGIAFHPQWKPYWLLKGGTWTISPSLLLKIGCSILPESCGVLPYSNKTINAHSQRPLLSPSMFWTGKGVKDLLLCLLFNPILLFKDLFLFLLFNPILLFKDLFLCLLFNPILLFKDLFLYSLSITVLLVDLSAFTV